MTDIQPITMPKWGLAMQEGTVSEWLVEPGAEITAGDEIVEIETSKITNVFESPVSGTLRRIVVAAGQTVPVGALLGVCAPASVDDAAIDTFVQEFLDSFDWEAAGATGGPEPQSIDTDAGRIRYLELGEGEGAPIIFVHGFGGDLLSWMFNQEALAESHRTIALDLPGHGGSTKTLPGNNAAALADAVLAFMDAKGIARAHFVGHSMGGAIALFLAARRAARTASATLIAPGGLGAEINMEFIDGFISQKRARKLRGIMEMLVADPGAITGEMIEEVIRFKRLDGVEAALTALRDGLFPGGRQAGSLREALSTLTVPVQVIWGVQDRILPAAHAEGLPETVPVTLLENTGHMPHMERAGEVNALIERIAR
ncbi:MAG: acetoin dehydrogenase dihydrolipoyllysine-residue acetyltransferase subunit [Alphaproteobacteria bacterium]|nr:MAG: acetoin dehydrogenase dihydrolipoyllysine-residue acetyltransferase subunit [Alphaproteobacteria bacterium]